MNLHPDNIIRVGVAAIVGIILGGFAYMSETSDATAVLFGFVLLIVFLRDKYPALQILTALLAIEFIIYQVLFDYFATGLATMSIQLVALNLCVVLIAAAYKFPGLKTLQPVFIGLILLLGGWVVYGAIQPGGFDFSGFQSFSFHEDRSGFAYEYELNFSKEVRCAVLPPGQEYRVVDLDGESGFNYGNQYIYDSDKNYIIYWNPTKHKEENGSLNIPASDVPYYIHSLDDDTELTILTADSALQRKIKAFNELIAWATSSWEKIRERAPTKIEKSWEVTIRGDEFYEFNPDDYPNRIVEVRSVSGRPQVFRNYGGRLAFDSYDKSHVDKWKRQGYIAELNRGKSKRYMGTNLYVYNKSRYESDPRKKNVNNSSAVKFTVLSVDAESMQKKSLEQLIVDGGEIETIYREMGGAHSFETCRKEVLRIVKSHGKETKFYVHVSKKTPLHVETANAKFTWYIPRAMKTKLLRSWMEDVGESRFRDAEMLFMPTKRYKETDTQYGVKCSAGVSVTATLYNYTCVHAVDLEDGNSKKIVTAKGDPK